MRKNVNTKVKISVPAREEYWPELDSRQDSTFSSHSYNQSIRLFDDDDDTLTIHSVEDLTLLDMMGLVNGTYDATGIEFGWVLCSLWRCLRDIVVLM